MKILITLIFLTGSLAQAGFYGGLNGGSNKYRQDRAAIIVMNFNGGPHVTVPNRANKPFKGTKVNTPDYKGSAEGKRGGAMHFTRSSSERIDLGGLVDDFLITSGGTALFWANNDDVANQSRYAFTCRDTSPLGGFWMNVNPVFGADFETRVGGVFEFIQQTTVGGTGWNHWTFTFEPSNDLGLFVNGVIPTHSSDSSPIGTPYNETADSLSIGGSSVLSTVYFNGLIDEVRLYNRILTQAEIYRIYLDGLAGNPYR